MSRVSLVRGTIADYSVHMHIYQSPEHDDCFAVRQAARHLSQLYERHLSAAGLTPTQFSILGALGRASSLTMAELARSMVMERTTLVRALKLLQRDGLVISEPSEHDGRTYLFSLSGAGKETFAQAAVAWRAAQDEFESKFGRSRAKALRAELFNMTAS